MSEGEVAPEAGPFPDRVQRFMNAAVNRYVGLALKMGELTGGMLGRTLKSYDESLRGAGVDVKPFLWRFTGRVEKLAATRLSRKD